jgi:hypothetical protein
MIKTEETVAHYAVFHDSKRDTRIVKVTSPNTLSEDGSPQVVLYKAITGYPGGPELIWRGYNFGSKPFYGFGRSVDDAVLDVINVINRQAEASIDTLSIIKMLVSEAASPVKLPIPKDDNAS